MVKQFSGFLVLVALALFQVACDRTAQEESAADIKAEIIEYGVYERKGEFIRIPDPTSPTGYVSRSDKSGEITLARETETVQMAQGVLFGYRVNVINLPDAEQHVFTLRYEFPPMITHEGQTTTSTEDQRRVTTSSRGVTGGIYYMLSEEYEMVPGEWKLTVLYKGDELASKTFTLIENENS